MSTVIKLSFPTTHEFWKIPVLFEDEHLLALDKPAGLLAAPDRFNPEQPSLTKLLHAGIAAGRPWATERALTYLSNAHRLDSETSGVLLFAKSKTALVTLADLFGSEKPVKTYIALVQGEPKDARFTVDSKLAPHPTTAGLMHVDPEHGKKSKTQFELLEKFPRHALLKCVPITDRAHQIRVHLRRAGLPIVGDSLYGGRPLLLSRIKPNYRLKDGKTERPLLSRTALHAEQLTLPHPVTGHTVTIAAPWPKDLKVAVKYLRQYAV